MRGKPRSFVRTVNKKSKSGAIGKKSARSSLGRRRSSLCDFNHLFDAIDASSTGKLLSPSTLKSYFRPLLKLVSDSAYGETVGA